MIKAENLHIEDQRTKILMVGRSGAGKSFAARSFPKPLYWICADGRLSALQGQKDIDIEIFKRDEGFSAIDRALDNNIIKPANPNYKTVVIAGLTAINRKLMQDSFKWIQPGKGTSEKQGGAQQIGDVIIGGWRNYLYVSNCWQQIIYNGIMEMRTNVILEAHIVNDYDDKGKVEGEKLLTTDKLAEEIPGCFDELWSFSAKESADSRQPSKRFVQFNGGIMARSGLVRSNEKFLWTNKDFYKEIFLPQVKG